MFERIIRVSLIIILSGFALPDISMCNERPVVCDRLYYDGEEGNLAYDIVGKFIAADDMISTLNLGKEIGEISGRKYRLYDILVDADFNGGGYFANWRVSGPRPMVEKYIRTLAESYKDKSVFYDFSAAKIDFKTTAFFEAKDAFEIQLSSSKQKYKSGEDIIVNAKIVNNMKAPALLVRCVDGSVRSWRYPQCAFEIKDSSGRIPENIFAPMCKTVNPLSPEDFVLIAPGESMELFDGGFVFSSAFKLKKPGKYYIFIRYSTVTLKEWQWYGLYSDEYWNERNSNEFWRNREKEILKNRELLENIERFSAKSNTIEVEITGKPVDRSEALKIGRDACILSGWKCNDLSAHETTVSWIITTNSKSLGMNGVIVIDKNSGEIIEKHITGP